MRLANTITRLKTIAALKQAVGGAVGYAKAIRGAVVTVPAAWVIPVGVRPQENPFASQVVQHELVTRVGLVLAVQNVRDPVGGHANEALQDLRDAVFAKLLNWSPGTGLGGFEYAGGALLDFDDQVLFWQDDFVTQSTIRSS